VWSFAGAAVGVTGGPFVVNIYPSTANEVTYTPTATGCLFDPPALSFSTNVDTLAISMTCNSVGGPYIQFAISGTDAVHYALPPPLAVSIQYGKCSIHFHMAYI
jgi:hypothetical protein